MIMNNEQSKLSTNRLLSDEKTKKRLRLFLFCSFLVNAILFLAVIAHNPPVWYTNDDYRMMSIVSGAYSGEPSPDIVFMRYPMGLFLSALYRMTTAVPWYGIFTMLCMYFPSCIFFYYLLKKTYEKRMTLLGVALYLLIFCFLIQKYISLPQYTLTSGFLGTGALAILHEMPETKYKKHIVGAGVLALLSFSVRSKAFYLLLPAFAVVIAFRVIKDKRKIGKYLICCGGALVLCLAVLFVDLGMWAQPGYAEFKDFKEARAQLYDYGTAPSYYVNEPFYREHNISEVTYRAIAGRFLDMDESVNTENLEAVSDYMKQIRNGQTGEAERLWNAFTNGMSKWYSSGDQTLKYASIFVTVLLFACIVLSARMRKNAVIFFVIVAIMVAEITMLEYIGRVMARLVDLLMLTMSVTGCLTLVELLNPRESSVKESMRRLSKNRVRAFCINLSVIATVLFVFTSVFNMQDDLDTKSRQQRMNINSRLEALLNYTNQYPDSFFFYDTNDFISSTEYVFKTYPSGYILNNESSGSWNMHSPVYYVRNQKFGFKTMADGLACKGDNVYFISLTTPKMGVTKPLKEIYNKKLVEVDRIQAQKNVLYVYMVTDDE